MIKNKTSNFLLAREGDLETLKMRHDGGILDIEEVCSQDRTIWYDAIDCNNLEIIKWGHENNLINWDHKDKWKISLKEYAKSSNKKNILEYIKNLTPKD